MNPVLTPVWMEDKEWTPFLDDGTLPVEYRSMPFVASRWSFADTCRIFGVYKNNKSGRQRLFNYWSWFAVPRAARMCDAMRHPWQSYV